MNRENPEKNQKDYPRTIVVLASLFQLKTLGVITLKKALPGKETTIE